MIEYLKVFLKRRKGQVSSIPISTILKIVLAVVVAATILFIFIPLFFDGLDFICDVLRAFVENIEFAEGLLDRLDFLEC